MAVSFTRLAGISPVLLLPSGPFQFGGQVHKGSLFVSPGGIYEWNATDLTCGEAGILRFLDEERDVRASFLLLGTGALPVLPPATLRNNAEERGLGLDFMDTRAACRTYNVLIAENRLFWAALLAL